MRVISGTSPFEYKVYYPKAICFTRERHTYILVKTDNTQPKAKIVLSIEDAGGVHVLEITRILDQTGTVVFPLRDVFEGFISTTATSYVVNYKFKLTLKASDNGLEGFDEDFGEGSLDLIMSGYSDREIDDVIDVDPALTNPYPYTPRIVIYPMLDRDISLFVPFITLLSNSIRVCVHSGDEVEAVLNGTQSPPFYTFNPNAVKLVDNNVWSRYDSTLLVQHIIPRPSIPGRPPSYSVVTLFYIAFEVDWCTNGVFLEWKDKHGLTHIYRWTLESTTEEISDSESYVQLDDTLQPIERQRKTLSKSFKLHSRKIDQSLFDLCKSIISNKELRMLNSETGEWELCSLDDTKSEDSGEVLKDLVINVVKNEYL